MLKIRQDGCYGCFVANIKERKISTEELIVVRGNLNQRNVFSGKRQGIV